MFPVLICNVCLYLCVHTNGTGTLPDGQWITGPSPSSLPEAAASVRFGEKALDLRIFSASSALHQFSLLLAPCFLPQTHACLTAGPSGL